MPWKVSGVMEKRKDFVADFVSGDWTMSELCRQYGISRPTGYAVLRRYAENGEPGLAARAAMRPSDIPTRRLLRSSRWF